MISVLTDTPLHHSLIHPMEPSRNPNLSFHYPIHHIHEILRLKECYRQQDEHYNKGISDDMVFYPMENIFHQLQINYPPLCLREVLLQIHA